MKKIMILLFVCFALLTNCQKKEEKPVQTPISPGPLQMNQELQLLQGLGNFRLIQVQALDEDLEGAQASLAYFAEQLADSPYVAAAQEWLAAFIASGDAAQACEAIASILEENPDMWQITDHFGYNHPALAAEQICFVP